MTAHWNRRDFLATTAAASVLGYFSPSVQAESDSPNEKLNIACVGVSGRARGNIAGVKQENIVAVCDVDQRFLDKASQEFPQAKTYTDYRKMFEQKNIDAVVVSTPDHMHAFATMPALQLGKHVYCEKPLTHSVYEARTVAEEAAKQKVATQMGTQIHAGNNYRRVVEIIRSGAIGPVKEVHVWVGKAWGGGDRPQKSDPVPSYLDWEQWLGPAPKRPYHENIYHPFHWRKWWDFGQGTLGDMACHYMDLPFWALELRYPTHVAATGPEVHPETCPLGLTVEYQFPARGDLPPVKLTWHDGDRVPKTIAGHAIPGSGVMFVGQRGEMFANYGSYKLYPEQQFADYQPPEPTIPNSIGHHKEWIRACKTGSATTCQFDYSGPLTEAVLLGNVAFRTGAALQWNAEALKAHNSNADEFIQREYRKGWSLEG